MIELAKQNNIDSRKVVSIEAEGSNSPTISPGGGFGDVDNVIRIKEQADHPTVTCLRCPFDSDVMPPQFKLDPIIKPEAACGAPGVRAFTLLRAHFERQPSTVAKLLADAGVV